MAESLAIPGYRNDSRDFTFMHLNICRYILPVQQSASE